MLGLVLLLLSLPEEPEEPEEDVRALEARMTELINIERDARGLEPLELHSELADVARSYSQKMAASKKVQHDLDRPMESRIRDALPDTCLFGENVSKHTSVDYSIGDLITSEGHRANLLHPKFTTIGVGIVRNDDDGYLYITQEFARRCDRRRRR